MLEIQDIFKQTDYLKTHTPPPHICKTVRAIQNCRTSALGGHMDTCDACGFMKISYNSCRNRHCPKCQALSKERWILAREADLLPVPYFHVVFTLPGDLSMLAFHNQGLVYDLMLKCSAETLRTLARDTKYLGAEVGCIAILHTWGQNLTYHPHVHIIVPGGGLTSDGHWKESRKKFFIPVRVLSKMFRGKFLYHLKQSLPKLDDDLLHALYQKDWYTYCKCPFKTTGSVLQYLGRYTHRVAISNHRLISFRDGRVSFKWRDYKDKSKEKVMSLAVDEFIRRFLLHVLPPRFTKIRHYGFLASAVKQRKLLLCKRLTGARASPLPERLSPIHMMLRLTGRDISLCPACGVGHFISLSGLSPPLAG